MPVPLAVVVLGTLTGSAHIDPAALVRDLGSPVFAVREKASRELWKLGPDAKPALAAAAAGSDDGEVRERAAAILDKFAWGVFPDTPPAVLAQIRFFRTGEIDKQDAAVAELLKLGRPGVQTLRVLLAREFVNGWRVDRFTHLAKLVRREVPRALAAGDAERAESLVALNALGPDDGGLGDYAAFMHLRGKSAEAAARLTATTKAGGPAAAAAAKALVFVHQAAGDHAAARRALDALPNSDEKPTLLAAHLEARGAWADLADQPLGEEVPQSRLGLAMHRHRRAGNADRVTALAATAKDAGGDDGLHSGEVYEAAVGLLLNGRSQDGIELLRAKRSQPHLLADLLAARLEFAEALDLVGNGPTAKLADKDTDPRVRAFYAVRRARLFAQLGRTEDAVQLFNQTADGVKEKDEYTIQQLLRAEVKAGRFDLAAEHAAKFVHEFDRGGAGFHLRPGPFEVLFEDDAAAARGWWVALRHHGPKGEAPGQTMRRVRELLGGTATPPRFAEAVKAMDAVYDSVQGYERVPDHFGRVPRATRAAALAVAHRAAGRPAVAEKYLTRAAEGTRRGSDDDDPDGPRAWVYGTDERFRPWLDLGDFLAQDGRHADAAARYYQGWERFPDNPLLLYLSGRSLRQAGDAAEGGRREELAHWVALGDAQARARFLEDLCTRGYLKAAARELDLTRRTAWTWERFRGNVWNQVARAAVLVKDYPAAADATERALHFVLRTTGITFVDGAAYLTAPTQVKSLRARASLAEGKADEAVAAATECLTALPAAWDVVTPLLPGLEKLGRKADADALFRAVWERLDRFAADHPRSAWAHNAAAAAAANSRRELDSALAHAKQAAELEPGVKAYRETLAEVHFRRGERDAALSLMKSLSATDSRNHLYRRQLVRYATGDVNSPVPISADD